MHERRLSDETRDAEIRRVGELNWTVGTLTGELNYCRKLLANEKKISAYWRNAALFVFSLHVLTALYHWQDTLAYKLYNWLLTLLS